MRVLITGANGYLGAALLRYIARERPAWDLHATFFSIPPSPGQTNAHSLDLREPASVERVLAAVQPDLIFHTAALNAGEAQEMYETNARGSDRLARGAAQHHARLVHVSSDVVFDGRRGNYNEDDAPHPITPYGVSKADAEQNVLASGAQCVLARTSLIYGFKPLDPRTRAVLRGEMPRLFTDERRCPIWVETLSAALVELGEMDYRGVLHVAGAQALNRYELGIKLMYALGGDTGHLIPAASAQSALVRPLDCTLDISRAQRILRTPLVGVDEMLARKNS